MIFYVEYNRIENPIIFYVIYVIGSYGGFST